MSHYLQLNSSLRMTCEQQELLRGEAPHRLSTLPAAEI